MITKMAIAGVLMALCIPTFVSAEMQGAQQKEPGGTAPQATGVPSFPPSPKCTANSPCQTVVGEVLRIEESYWVRGMDGREIHMKVDSDTNMKQLPKVGDPIAAQLSSNGEAQAIVKLSQIPQKPKLEVPSKSFEDLR